MASIRTLITTLIFAVMAVSGPVSAHHVTGASCGIKSGSFARICRPGAASSCLSATERGIKGFSKTFCEKRTGACSFCLKLMQRCIKNIGHGARSQYSCDECGAKFSRCIGKRYPVLAN